MINMNDKKAELEKKKLLLEDLKKRKLEREKQKVIFKHSFCKN